MKQEDGDTRYFVDLDLEKMTILGWNYGQRKDLIKEELQKSRTRIYITKGQYNKLKK